MKRLCGLLFILALSLRTIAFAAEFDLVLRHGQIVDGLGKPAYAGDLAVKDGKIAAVGQVQGSGKNEIDLHSMIVAPGFIDVHSHGEDIVTLQEGENYARMGVTTIIVGNCGGSEPDLAAFFQQIENNKVSLNVGSLIGHNTVREKAMGGSFDRPPSAEEMAKMKAMVDKAMKDGAVGLSTGLIYLPGTFSTTDEIVELAKAIAPYDGIYASHMRSEGDRITQAMEEVFRVAREDGVRAEISHIKLTGRKNWGKAPQILAAIEKARAEGLRVTQDQYAYTAGSTTMGQTIPDWAKEGKKFAERLDDPAGKAKIIAGMKEILSRRGESNYWWAVIGSYRHDKSLNGLNIVEAAKKTRGSDSLQNQIELLLEIQKNGSASGVFHGINEADLQIFMRHTNTMFGADSGVRKLGEGVPHPRGYGNNARILGHYVRDLKLLSLEEAVRKMTSLPASTFQIKNRGRLCSGNWADIAVFDPAAVQENCTYKDPHHYATGFKYVFVNGEAVVKDDAHTGAKPGKVIRHNLDEQGGRK